MDLGGKASDFPNGGGCKGCWTSMAVGTGASDKDACSVAGKLMTVVLLHAYFNFLSIVAQLLKMDND